MFAQQESVIGRNDQGGVLPQPVFIEIVKKTAQLFVAEGKVGELCAKVGDGLGQAAV